MSKNLYQKYPANKWEDVVGQKFAVLELQEKARTNTLPQNFLFSGKVGVGKTTLGRLVAKAKSCENQDKVRIDGNPCNECDQCTDINNEWFMRSAREYNGENIGVDDARAIENWVINGGDMLSLVNQIPMIDEFQGLYKSNSKAAGIFLQVMQKHIQGVCFILGTSNVNALGNDIISRCSHFRLQPIPFEDIAKKLMEIGKAEGMPVTDDSIKVIFAIAESVNGSLRDGYDALERCLGSKLWSVDQVIVELGMADTDTVSLLAQKIMEGDSTALANYIHADILDRIRECLLALYKRHYNLPLLPIQKDYSLKVSSKYHPDALKITMDRLDDLRKYSYRDPQLIDRAISECVIANKPKRIPTS